MSCLAGQRAEALAGSVNTQNKTSIASRLGHLFSASGPKLLKDLVSLVCGQFAGMVLGFVAFSYLARQLTTELYGTVELIVSMSAFAAIVIECGVNMIAVREMARPDANPSRIATAAVAARGLIAMAVVPVFIIGVLLVDLPTQSATLCILFAISLLFAPLKQEWLLQSREHMRLAALGQPLRAAVFAALVVLLVGSGDDVLFIGVAETVAVALLMSFYLTAQYWLGAPFRWRDVSGRVLYYVREGLAIGLSNILWAFMLYAPMTILAVLTDSTEANAWLGASLRIVVAIVTASFLYHFNIYPVVTRTVSADRERWRKLIRSSIHIVAWGGFGLTLVLSILADEVMTTVFGHRFVAAGPVFATLIWAFPLRFLSGHARWSLIADGQQKWLLIAEIAGAATLLATALLTIPALGAVGAALSLVAGIAISGMVTQYRAEITLGRFGLVGDVLPAFATSLAAFAACSQLPFGAAGQSLSAIAIYLAVLAFRLRKLKNDFHVLSYAKAE